MLGFGTLAYGLALGLAMPGWIALDERPDARTPLARVILWVALAVALDTTAVAAIRAFVAPRLTVVEDPSAPGWDAAGCLADE
jgi:hypothetical protein